MTPANLHQTADTRPTRCAVACLIAVALFAFALCLQQLWNADIWWQLATGRWIVEHHAVPRQDPFSYTAAGREWIEMRWLFCLMAYLGWQTGGAALLILAQAAIVLTAFTIAAWPGRPALLRCSGLIVLALGVAGASSRFVVRPELVTFLFLAVFLATLTRHTQTRDQGQPPTGQRPAPSRAAIWALPVLQVIWTNAHTLWSFGPFLTWVFFFSDTAHALIRSRGQSRSIARDRRPKPSQPHSPRVSRTAAPLDRSLLLVALLTTAACLLNPYGWGGITFPLVLMHELRQGSVIRRVIEEIASPLAAPISQWGWDLWAAAILALLSAAVFIRNWRTTNLARLIVWVTFLVLACWSRRNLAPFSLVSVWATLLNLAAANAKLSKHQNIKTPNQPLPSAAGQQQPSARIRQCGTTMSMWASGALTLLLLALTWTVITDRLYIRMGSIRRFGLGVLASATPAGAITFISGSGASPKMFHSLGDGGYLIWAGNDKVPVCVDGRLEVYGEEIIGQYVDLPRRNWQAFADDSHINTVLIEQERLGWLADRLQSSPGWVLVYLDPRSLVYVRDIPEHAAFIARDKIDLNRPWQPRPAEPDERPGGWRRWLGAAATPWYSLGMAETFLRLGSPDNAAVYLDKGLQSFPGDAQLRLLRAAIHRFRRQSREAEALLRQVPASPEMVAWSERILADLLTRSGRHAEAIEPLRRAVQAQPDDAVTRVHLAEAYADAKNPAQALTEFQEVLRLRPKDPGAWIRFGALCEGAGNPDSAEAAYRQALDIDAAQFRAWQSLGLLLARRGDKPGAKSCLEQAQRLRPNDASVRNLLQELQGG